LLAAVATPPGRDAEDEYRLNDAPGRRKSPHEGSKYKINLN
jgi:hypothetical protein